MIRNLMTFASLLFLFSCQETKNSLLIDHKITKTVAPMTSYMKSAPEAEIVEMHLSKKALLDRQFLYGTTLQFSSLKDAELDVSYANLNMGASLAYFNIIGNKLLLLQDTSILVESDINHPAKLIHEFTILSQNGDTLWVKADKASPALGLGWMGPESATLEASWIRSFTTDAEKNILMIETSVQATNGSAAEFMEFIIPRDQLVTGSDKAIFADANVNPLAERYRFLDAGPVFVKHPEEGRIKTLVANRFKLENRPISWWTTNNAPKEFMNEIRAGVEAWNRYSQALWGKDIVKFEGILPDGIKIGDPRYNTILWDGVAEAGAAYESQNADPLTGIQINSNIYLPAAWVNIGMDYWAKYALSDSDAVNKIEKDLSKRSFLGKKISLHCLNDIKNKIGESALTDSKKFGRELLKGVLFHEMGHALGLAHNFKGSLTHNPDDLKSPFSSSIMDYNQFNEELGAYDSLESISGPLLEYDRQMIATLYNNGKGISETDPVLPACDDDEAYSMEGGVDPLCVPYDIGRVPTERVIRGIELLSKEEAVAGRMTSLPAALKKATHTFPTHASIQSSDELNEILAKLLVRTEGLISIYFSATANSVGTLGSFITKNLFVTREGVLPEGYDENLLRDEAVAALNWILFRERLPKESQGALNALETSFINWAKKSPSFKVEFEQEIQKGFLILGKKIERLIFPKMRIRIIKELKFHPENPFYMQSVEGQVTDYELFTITHLERLSLTIAHPFGERDAAIQSLLTFKGTENGYAALGRVYDALKLEEKEAKDAATRDTLRKMISRF